MTGAEVFTSHAADLLAAAEHPDSKLLALARDAIKGLEHYELPIGWKHVDDPVFPSPCWVAAFHMKLESPNWFMRDHRIRAHLRLKWRTELRTMVERVEGFATFAAMTKLGHAPTCYDRMAIQVVRFAPTSRGFLRDEDNSAFCTKQLSDALVDVGLVKSDRREWFTAAPLLQDVSPIVGFPVTLLILRPAPADAPRLTGVPRAHHPQRQIPHFESVTPHRRAKKRRAVSRARGKSGS